MDSSVSNERATGKVSVCSGNGVSVDWDCVEHTGVDMWRMILQKLPMNALGQAACVCRTWRTLASDPIVLSHRFMDAWGLAHVVGKPLSARFWRDADLKCFAVSHKINQWDSVASLAVKYQVHIADIKQLNNMMSDHGIYTRVRLLIPVKQKETLKGKTCYIELDPYAKREVAVIYLDDQAPRHSSSLHCTETGNDTRKECFKQGIVDSLKKSLNVDDATAHYYLSAAGGDIRKAFSQYKEDLIWETTHNRQGFSMRV